MRPERNHSAVYLAVLTQMKMVHQKQMMVRKHHNHLQAMWLDMTLEWCHIITPPHRLLGTMPRAHDKSIFFRIILWAAALSLTSSSFNLITTDYVLVEICHSRIPKHDLTWTAQESLNQSSTSPGDSAVTPLLCCFLRANARSKVKLYCYTNLAIILHSFRFCNLAFTQ